jgi:rfaE bifunctional protein nucleotidyltransferase chain/domain
LSSAIDPNRKVMTADAAADWRRRSGRVVFTNGVFDLLHPGHVDLLVAARALGDALVVGVNTDASVMRLKGPSRPVRNERERAYVLAALESVDAVVLFSEDTPLELIRHIMPDVLVKGGDYSVDTVVGASDVLAHGGDVVIVPLTPGQSTTGTLQKVQSGGQQ